MQPKLNEFTNNSTNSIYSSFRIKNHGKLPNSSYYDVPGVDASLENASSFNNADLSDGPYEQQQQQQINDSQQHQALNNENLEVWSCVFSPDNSHLAWTCGYGLIKIMKWHKSYFCKKSQTRKNIEYKFFKNQSSSNLTNLSMSSPINNNSCKNRDGKSVNEIIEIDCGELVHSLAFGSNKSYLKYSGNARRKADVYTRFIFDEDHLILAAGLASGKIRIYDALNGKFLFGLFDHMGTIRDLKFTKDGSLQLASASRDSTIKLWNMYDDGNMYKTLKGHLGAVLACDWSPTENFLVSGGASRQAFVWCTETFKIVHQLKGHLHDVVCVEFSPDGALIATASFDTKICLWDTYTGQLLTNFYHLMPPPSFIYAGGCNQNHVRKLAFSSNGDHLVSICDDKKLRVYSLCSRGINPISEGEHKDGISLAYNAKSRIILTGTRNGHLDVHEVPIIIPKLIHLCRKAVNLSMSRKQIQTGCIPNELKRFLAYEDISNKPRALSPTLPSASKPSNKANDLESSSIYQKCYSVCN